MVVEVSNLISVLIIVEFKIIKINGLLILVKLKFIGIVWLFKIVKIIIIKINIRFKIICYWFFMIWLIFLFFI